MSNGCIYQGSNMPSSDSQHEMYMSYSLFWDVTQLCVLSNTPEKSENLICAKVAA
jgi:hypothetical protein